MEVDEPSIHDSMDPTPMTYQIINDATQRRKELLVDSLGYRYGVQRRLKTTVHWQCTVRPSINPCRAKVTQSASGFKMGIQSHNHPSTPGAALVAKITKKIKEAAVNGHIQACAYYC